MHIADANTVHLPTHYFRQTKHPQEINGAYYVSGVKDEFVQLWVYLKDTNWTQFVLKSSLSANPNLFKDKMKGFTPFTQSSNSLVAQVIHFSGRVIGFRVGFYLKFKLIVRSGPIMDRLGRVFRFSGTRSSPRRHIWSLDNWTWDNWIHVQMSRSPNIRGGSGLRFSSSGGLGLCVFFTDNRRYPRAFLTGLCFTGSKKRLGLARVGLGPRPDPPLPNIPVGFY